ncbi:MAG: histidine kinase [Sphingobacteriales bacterium]|nr:histidine kinase [Sphingobacteriales bacterium]
MKKIAYLVLILISFETFAQQKPIRLIVRGDDMGYSHSGNEALIKSYKEGIETSIEVLVPSPWFPEAVKMLNENPGVDVGIHLALTSEWDNIKWRPLSDCPSLKNSDGYFFPMIYPNKNYPQQALLENKWTIKDIEKEFRAQIELALKRLPQVSHISSHMNCTNMNEEVKVLTKKLAKEYKIKVDPETDYQGIVGYNGPSKTSEEKINSFLKMIDKLESGKTYVFIDHPGINNEELQAVHHIGYENVSIDRQGVTDVFTNKRVKDYIKQKGIQLIGYKDLVPAENTTGYKVLFNLYSPDLSSKSAIYITGGSAQLGNWNPDKVKMGYKGNHTWSKEITVDKNLSIEYKYTLGAWEHEGADARGMALPNFNALISKDTIIKDSVSFWTKGKRKIMVKGRITGKLKFHPAMKWEGLKDRDVTVWLPDGYEKNANKRYAVLYLQDGQNLFDASKSSFGVEWGIDESVDSLIKIRAIPPVIVVGINNTADRSKEYAPGEMGTAYMNFVVEKLKPFIDKTYRTMPDSKHTIVGGSSSGGLISFMLTWQYPDVFAKAICMSPALKISDLDYVKVVNEDNRERKNVFFYLDNGGFGLESELRPGIDEMIAALNAKGYQEGKDFVFIVAPEAHHFEAAWAKRFPEALKIVLGAGLGRLGRL